MLKKIVLSIVAMALLLGIESLIAQERKGKPEEKQKQKAQAKQLHEQQLCKKAGRKREEGEIIEQRPPVFGPMQNWPIIREREECTAMSVKFPFGSSRFPAVSVTHTVTITAAISK